MGGLKRLIKRLEKNPIKEINRVTKELKTKEIRRTEVKTKRPIGMEYQDRYHYRKTNI